MGMGGPAWAASRGASGPRERPHDAEVPYRGEAGGDHTVAGPELLDCFLAVLPRASGEASVQVVADALGPAGQGPAEAERFAQAAIRRRGTHARLSEKPTGGIVIAALDGLLRLVQG